MKRKLLGAIIILTIALAAEVSYAMSVPPEIAALEKRIQQGDQEALKDLNDKASHSPTAAKILGIIYFKGLGPAKSTRKALEFFEQAAQMRDAESTKLLVKIYSNQKSPYYNPDKAQYFKELLGNSPNRRDNETNDSHSTHEVTVLWPRITDPVRAPTSSGSSFAINGSGYFVTNHHVTENCSQLLVIYNGSRAYGEVVASSKEADLSVLKVNQKTPYFLVLRNQGAKIGEKVRVAGYPTFYFKFSEGVVSATEDKSLVFQFSASVSSGSSGGPVVDQSSALIGVVSRMIAPGRNSLGNVMGADFNYAIAANHLFDFLSSNGIQTYQSKVFRPVRDQEVAKILQKTTALIFCF